MKGNVTDFVEFLGVRSILSLHVVPFLGFIFLPRACLVNILRFHAKMKINITFRKGTSMMRRRYEITDEAWEKIAPLLPSNGKRGGQWKDHRTILNGILWKFGTGAPWRDLPERYGSWKTCYYRFTRWQKDGTWDRLLKYVQTYSHAVSDVDWVVFVDSTIVRAHQHAAGAPKKGGSSLPK
jgi:transposase